MKMPVIFMACILGGVVIKGLAGTPHTVYGRIYNSDGSVPSQGSIEFSANMISRPDEVQTHHSIGAGYEGGYWYLNAGNFNTDWITGDTLQVYLVNRTIQEDALLLVVLTSADPDSAQPVSLEPYVSYSLQLDVRPQDGGYTTPASGDYVYAEDSNVSISAFAQHPYRFAGWSGDIVTTDSPQTTVIMNRDRIITAEFELITWELQCRSEPEGAGIFLLSPEKENYITGESVTVQAIGRNGYFFDHWSASHTGTDSSITVVMDRPKSLVAHFYRVDVSEPTLKNCFPNDNGVYLPTNCRLYFTVEDLISGVDYNSIKFYLNDVLIYANGKTLISGDLVVDKIDSAYSFMYRKKFDFAKQEKIAVRIEASDLSQQQNHVDTLFTFQTGKNRIYPRVGRRVGKSGAELKDWNTKIRMVVPPGALQDSIFIDINITDKIPALPDSIVQLGETFYISPGGLSFDVPATVHIPFRWEDFDAIAEDPSRNLFALFYSPANGYWQGLTIQDRIENFVPVHIPECGYLTLAVRPAEVLTPLLKPNGPSHPLAGLLYSYTVGSTRSSYDQAIEYRFEWGDGSFSPWSPDTTALHVFQQAGQHNVRAFARSSADTTKNVASPTLVTTTAKLDAPEGANVLLQNMPYTFNLSLTPRESENLEFQFDWGDGRLSAWKPERKALNSWSETGDYIVIARARRVSDTTRTVNSTDSLHVKVTILPAPAGSSSAMIRHDYLYRIHPHHQAPLHKLEYMFCWGDSTAMNWTETLQAVHRWENAGVYNLFYMARDTEDTTRIAFSDSITVRVQSIVLAAEQEAFFRGFPGTFSVQTMTAPTDQNYEYRFLWGDGSVSSWSSNEEITHAWERIGEYQIAALARLRDDTVRVIRTPPLSVLIQAIPSPMGEEKLVPDQMATWSAPAVQGIDRPLSWRFVWGDGTTSPWSEDSTASHAYTEPGVYPVVVQARLYEGEYLSSSDTLNVQVSFPASMDKSELSTPQSFDIFPNFPNPFNPRTSIQYQLPRAVSVRIAIYNISGQCVRTLLNQMQPPGLHRVNWDGRNERGESVSGGIYIARFRAGTFAKSIKMSILH
ncbi:T9SS type A sorting domain-containing protein [candidate division KSB1 bacterium]|nr:T9SS type A sorting domain-containing protein [candidate division KSB1 bacterium]